MIDETAITTLRTLGEFGIFMLVAYFTITRVVAPLISALIASNKERASANLTLAETLKDSSQANKNTAEVLANVVKASQQLHADAVLIVPAITDKIDALHTATKTIATDVAKDAVTDIKRTLKADADATRAGFASVTAELSGIRADMQTDRAADRKWGERIEQTIDELRTLVAGLSAGAENKTSAVSAAPVGAVLSDS